jgi:quercetin dioxygenase-like cupin family protein
MKHSTTEGPDGQNWNSVGKSSFRRSQQKHNKNKPMKTIKNLAFVSGLWPGRGMTARTAMIVGVAVAATGTALVGVALATPSSGIISGTILARASFVDPVDLKFKINAGSEEVIHVSGAKETVMQQIVIGPGGYTGWHSHPGPAIALIKSGSLALYSSDDTTCTPRNYQAGQAFIDHGQGHVHFAHNPSGTENVEVWVTYFDVPTGSPVRIDAANPGNCGF